LPQKLKPLTKKKAIIRASETAKFKVQDHIKGCGFFPSITFRAKEERGLSKIKHTEKEITIWKQILREHKIEMPELASTIQERL
jgi:hypothetical protein